MNIQALGVRSRPHYQAISVHLRPWILYAPDHHKLDPQSLLSSLVKASQTPQKQTLLYELAPCE